MKINECSEADTLVNKVICDLYYEREVQDERARYCDECGELIPENEGLFVPGFNWICEECEYLDVEIESNE